MKPAPPSAPTSRSRASSATSPPGLKFLKPKPTGATQVQLVGERYATAYPHIRFSYSKDGDETFRTNGTDKLREST